MRDLAVAAGDDYEFNRPGLNRLHHSQQTALVAFAAEVGALGITWRWSDDGEGPQGTGSTGSTATADDQTESVELREEGWLRPRSASTRQAPTALSPRAP